MLNSEFCCPSTTMSPSVLPRGTLMLSGKQNSLFLLGPVIKCLVFLSKTLDSHSASLPCINAYKK